MKARTVATWKNGVASIAIIVAFLVSSVPHAMAIPDPDDKIAAIIDGTPDQEVLILHGAGAPVPETIAMSIFRAIKPIYPMTKVRAVSTMETMIGHLKARYMITILVFDTNQTGFISDGEIISFDDVACHLVNLPQEIVYSSGNARDFSGAVTRAFEAKQPHVHQSFTFSGAGLPVNIHLDPSRDEIDAESLFLTSTWEIANIFERRTSNATLISIGKQIRYHAVRYFEQNMNSIVEGAILPRTSMGIEEPAIKAARFQAAMSAAPRNASGMTYTTGDNGSTPEAPRFYIGRSSGFTGSELVSTDEAAATHPDGIQSSGYGDLGLDSDIFSIFQIPRFSGLDGPIASVVDELLGMILGFSGDSIGLDTSVINQITGLVGQIKSIMSLGSGSVESATGILKELINALKHDFPFPRDMDGYFDILVNAIFVFQSKSTQAIKGLLESTLALILPTDVNSMIGTVLDFMGFDSLGSLTSLFTDTKKTISTLLTHVQENFLKNIVDSLLSTYAGITENVKDRLVGLVTTAMNFIVEFDPEKLVKGLIDDLIKTAFNLASTISPYQQEFEMLMQALVNSLLSYMGWLDGNKLVDVLIDYIVGMIPDSVLNLSIQGITDKYDAYKAMVNDAVDFVKDAINDGMSSVTSFVDGIKTRVLRYVKTEFQSQYADHVEFIAKVLAFVNSLKSGFTPAQVPSLSDLIQYMLENVLDLSGATLANVKQVVDQVTNGLMGIIAVVKGDQDLIDLVKKSDIIKNYMDNPQKLVQFILEDVLGIHTTLGAHYNTFKDTIATIISLVKGFQENSIQGIMQGLLQGLGFVVAEQFNLNLSVYVNLLKKLFSKQLGLPDLTSSEISGVIQDLLSQFNVDPADIATVKKVLEAMFAVRGVFDNGIKWLFNQVASWVAGQVQPYANQIISALESALGADVLSQDFTFPIGLGSFSFFQLKLAFGLSLGFNFDVEGLFGWVVDMIFKGDATLSISDAGKMVKKILSFFEFTPRFKASMEVDGFDSENNPLISMLLKTLGLKLTFSGGGDFTLQLFSVKQGSLKRDGFFKIIAWSFKFNIEVSRDFTLIDFITGGAGGVLNELASYIGLDLIVITVKFGIAVSVTKSAPSASGSESSMLEIALTIGLAVKIGLDLLIIAFELRGSLDITFTFKQDLSDTSKPLEIWFTICLTFKLKIDWPWPFGDSTFQHSWYFGTPVNLTPKKDSGGEFDDNVLGPDSDGDGLSDEFELSIGTDPYNPDTDGDGLSDKFELYVSKTDPLNPDTDGDGLSDYDEWEVHNTSPTRPDTDFDGLTDYEEIVVYGTDPFLMDTDQDGLDDYFEVTFAWDMTGVVPSVTSVMIGGKAYTDRTDPLNPDTDGDGLLDGEEGPFGGFYRPDNATDVEGHDHIVFNEELGVHQVLFNKGYTHPLCNDTDGDSYYQFSNGTRLTVQQAQFYLGKTEVFLISMTDFEEIHGKTVLFYNITTEEWEWVTFRTNPCMPDSDADSGHDLDMVLDPFHIDPLAPLIINSDGYELHLTPPTDPLDGDSDKDGLLDGQEGFLIYGGYHTNPLNPDTDGDGLPDFMEIALGTDPRDPDTDKDGITDGDEVFLFHTNPLLPDTDFDGLTDGEEVFLFHCNPLMPDSDGDGFTDGYEVLFLGTDPMDEDTDNDGLSDWEEINVYFTDPLNWDTDGDGLSDGEEVLGILARFPVVREEIVLMTLGAYSYNHTVYTFEWEERLVRTNPLAWDTDGDSIIHPNGTIVFSMSDYEEIFLYKTNPNLRDTDSDGITDGWEVYLSTVSIPYFSFPDVSVDNNSVYTREELHQRLEDRLAARAEWSPFLLSPHMRDSDGDGIIDGQEIRLFNVTFLLYPFISLAASYPFGTSPIHDDTDGDGIIDGLEVFHFTSNPNNTDSDMDGLPDLLELLELNWTAITNNDTDGDGLDDYTEYYSGNPLVPRPPDEAPGDGVCIPYPDPLNPDTDGDGALDGAEVHFYRTDPTNPTSITMSQTQPDGQLFDSDGDGINDYLKVMVYKTHRVAIVTHGVAWSTDSDGDGISDHDEIKIYGTNPANVDSDFDGYSDLLEILLGSDPNAWDSHEYIEGLIAARLTRTRVILVIVPAVAILAIALLKSIQGERRARNRASRRSEAMQAMARGFNTFMTRTRAHGLTILFVLACLACLVPQVLAVMQVVPVLSNIIASDALPAMLLGGQLALLAVTTLVLAIVGKMVRKTTTKWIENQITWRDIHA